VNGNRPEVRDTEDDSVVWTSESIFLRVKVTPGPYCEFSYSADGKKFATSGDPFLAQPGGWVGARVGLFCLAPADAKTTGYVDVDWFRFER
jgi:hypothetical protein